MGKLLQMPLLFEALEAAPEETAVIGPAAHGSLLPQPEVSDAEARKQALNIGQSCIVEAPAGSGKTGLLIQRFLRLLAEGGVHRPDEILAITFTRKADGEMRRRVLEELTAAAAGKPLPADARTFERQTRLFAESALARDRELGWRLLETPQQLNIRTIDSFCAQLAGGLPLLAGPGGRYQPTDDPTPLYEAAAERTLLQMGGPDAALSHDIETLLEHRDANVQDLQGLLADMLRQREQWGELVPLSAEKLTDAALDAEVRPRLSRTLERITGTELQTLMERLGPSLLSSISLLAHQMSTLHGRTEESPLLPFVSDASAPGARGTDLPRWKALAHLLLTGKGWRQEPNAYHLKFEIQAEQKAELNALLDAFRARDEQHPGLLKAFQDAQCLPDPGYPDDQWRIVRPLCRVLYAALLELQIVFAERRSCDFTEVSLTARSLLRQQIADDGMITTMIGNLRHLLVDEMQDTSSGQYELLRKLTDGWDGTSHTLFLVGDPKQSIYEFRLARVERFRQVMEQGRFGQINLQPLRLTSNFRTQAHLVAGFNRTFRAILPTPEALVTQPDSADVPFVEAVALRPGNDQVGDIRWHIDWEESAEDAAVPPAETGSPETIRRTIEDFLNSWPDPQDASSKPGRPARVAVLARNRSHFAPLVREFQTLREGRTLPFRAVEIESLNERSEILDLLALTRALLHPGDRVAWLSVLRSPAFGLGLGDLLLLTGEGPEADRTAPIAELVARRGMLLSTEGQALLQRSWPSLSTALAEAGRHSLPLHVERTWRSLGLDAPLSASQHANADRFLQLLHTLWSGPEPFSLGLLRRRLKMLYAGPGEGEAQVELMTIHKAKGLEWDLVIVPSLERRPRENDANLLTWLEFEGEDGISDFFLAPIQSKGETSSSLTGWLRRRQQQREAAETRRLFYVACTRARESLHLLATVKRKQDGEVSRPADNCLLGAAWPAVTADLLPAPPLARSSLPPALDSDREPEVLPLAASAASNDEVAPESERPAPLQRLPLSFQPLERLRVEQGAKLTYPDPATLRRSLPFVRPEGSFTARAFGNAVHRFLQLAAERLGENPDISAMQEEVNSWSSRAVAVLRSEGLGTPEATAEAVRLLKALQNTLADPYGAWLLQPRAAARNESAPSVLPEGVSLRADRTFLAGADPLSTTETTHLWILDYKTAEPGGRDQDVFLAQQKAKYLPQMEAYAAAALASGRSPARIRLALFFPLIPAFLWWQPTVNPGPEDVTSV